jgi:cellulose synthase/poly-beta-1,6-N-acetylglucosamine synthase-like glycosyltransferase
LLVVFSTTCNRGFLVLGVFLRLPARMARVHPFSFVQDPATRIAELADAQCARRTLTRAQQRWLRATGTLLAWAALLHPAALFGTLHGLLTGLFLVLIGWRALLVWVGRRGSIPEAPMPDGPFSSRWAMPRYTILVALYRERLALPGLIRALDALDYPKDQLEIMFLVEDQDTETAQALSVLSPPPHMHIVTVPPGIPRTKPRALNHGLLLATGHFLVVYDAEDRPHPLQLREAVTAFMCAPSELACLQAPLRAYNARETWISGQWALEYLVHFQRLVPALARMKLPVPLGGTSNHFRIHALRDSGGWDPWNVTEDADLGIRFARRGLRTGVIESGTLEEAPTRLGAWTAQRSRWFKGHAQTWLVAMRNPVGLLRELGPGGFLVLQLSLLGTVLSGLLHGTLALWFLAGLLVPGLDATALDIVVLCAGLGVNFWAACEGARQSPHRLLALILTQPFYWPLHTPAALRALYGLIRRPHYWVKTEHGVSEIQGEPVRPAYVPLSGEPRRERQPRHRSVPSGARSVRVPVRAGQP